MATQVLKDCTIWLGQYDLTSDVTEWQLGEEYAELDATNFGSGGKTEWLAGLLTTDVTLQTFLNTATGRSEPAVRSLLGTTNNLLTVTPNGTANDAAFSLRGLLGKASKGGKVGDIMPLSVSGKSNATEGTVHGRLILPKAARGSTSTSSAYQNGAVTATQRVYCGLHVFAASGTTPTLDVVLFSDDNSGMTSATSRIAMTQATAVGYELKSLAGAITDDYWRITYTIGGTGPSFTFAVVMGIETIRS